MMPPPIPNITFPKRQRSIRFNEDQAFPQRTRSSRSRYTSSRDSESVYTGAHTVAASTLHGVNTFDDTIYSAASTVAPTVNVTSHSVYTGAPTVAASTLQGVNTFDDTIYSAAPTVAPTVNVSSPQHTVVVDMAMMGEEGCDINHYSMDEEDYDRDKVRGMTVETNKNLYEKVSNKMLRRNRMSNSRSSSKRMIMGMRGDESISRMSSVSRVSTEIDVFESAYAAEEERLQTPTTQSLLRNHRKMVAADPTFKESLTAEQKLIYGSDPTRTTPSSVASATTSSLSTNKGQPLWKAIKDKTTFKYYYYNTETKEVTWTKPVDYFEEESQDEKRKKKEAENITTGRARREEAKNASKFEMDCFDDYDDDDTQVVEEVYNEVEGMPSTLFWTRQKLLGKKTMPGSPKKVMTRIPSMASTLDERWQQKQNVELRVPKKNTDQKLTSGMENDQIIERAIKSLVSPNIKLSVPSMLKIGKPPAMPMKNKMWASSPASTLNEQWQKLDRKNAQVPTTSLSSTNANAEKQDAGVKAQGGRLPEAVKPQRENNGIKKGIRQLHSKRMPPLSNITESTPAADSTPPSLVSSTASASVSSEKRWRVLDKKFLKTYYYNVETKEVTWNKPKGAKEEANELMVEDDSVEVDANDGKEDEDDTNSVSAGGFRSRNPRSTAGSPATTSVASSATSISSLRPLVKLLPASLTVVPSPSPVKEEGTAADGSRSRSARSSTAASTVEQSMASSAASTSALSRPLARLFLTAFPATSSSSVVKEGQVDASTPSANVVTSTVTVNEDCPNTDAAAATAKDDKPNKTAVTNTNTAPQPVWKGILDKKSLKMYYYNVKTKEVTWTKPQDFDFAEVFSNNVKTVPNAGKEKLKPSGGEKIPNEVPKDKDEKGESASIWLVKNGVFEVGTDSENSVMTKESPGVTPVSNDGIGRQVSLLEAEEETEVPLAEWQERAKLRDDNDEHHEDIKRSVSSVGNTHDDSIANRSDCSIAKEMHEAVMPVADTEVPLIEWQERARRCQDDDKEDSNITNGYDCLDGDEKRLSKVVTVMREDNVSLAKSKKIQQQRVKSERVETAPLANQEEKWVELLEITKSLEARYLDRQSSNHDGSSKYANDGNTSIEVPIQEAQVMDPTKEEMTRVQSFTTKFSLNKKFKSNKKTSSKVQQRAESERVKDVPLLSTQETYSSEVVALEEKCTELRDLAKTPSGRSLNRQSSSRIDVRSSSYAQDGNTSIEVPVIEEAQADSSANEMSQDPSCPTQTMLLPRASSSKISLKKKKFKSNRFFGGKKKKVQEVNATDDVNKLVEVSPNHVELDKDGEIEVVRSISRSTKKGASTKGTNSTDMPAAKEMKHVESNQTQVTVEMKEDEDELALEDDAPLNKTPGCTIIGKRGERSEEGLIDKLFSCGVPSLCDGNNDEEQSTSAKETSTSPSESAKDVVVVNDECTNEDSSLKESSKGAMSATAASSVGEEVTTLPGDNRVAANVKDIKDVDGAEVVTDGAKEHDDNPKTPRASATDANDDFKNQWRATLEKSTRKTYYINGKAKGVSRTKPPGYYDGKSNSKEGSSDENGNAIAEEVKKDANSEKNNETATKCSVVGEDDDRTVEQVMEKKDTESALIVEEEPDENKYWRAKVDTKSSKVYYYNRKTNEVSWVKPPGFDDDEESSSVEVEEQQREVEEVEEEASIEEEKKSLFVDTVHVDESAKYWRATLDKSTEKTYYFNKKTKEVSWTKPGVF